MTDNEIALICKRCREYDKAAGGMPATADTNAAIKDIRAKAQVLRLALKEMPGVVRVNLPAGARKMLEPERQRHSDDALEQAAFDFISSQEPELLRLLRSIEDGLQGMTARVNIPRGAQPDYYSECVLEAILGHAHEYKSTRAAVYALAGKFNLDADMLYRKHTRKK